MLLLPIILLALVVLILVGSLSGTLNGLFGAGSTDTVQYEESVFQSYANTQYAAEFSGTSAYENNLLICFLVNDACDGYYTIAFVGDNLRSEISELFGNEQTVFGRAVISSVSSYYGYSLGSNLATVMDTMTASVQALGLDSSFRTGSSVSSSVTPHLTNHTKQYFSTEAVSSSLQNFTDQTGIPAVIVVDRMEDVFPSKSHNRSSTLIGIGAVLVAVVLIALLLGRRNTGTVG